MVLGSKNVQGRGFDQISVGVPERHSGIAMPSIKVPQTYPQFSLFLKLISKAKKQNMLKRI